MSSPALVPATLFPTHAQTARPFIKWAGGKTRLLPKILPYVPTSFGTYFEPFLGGGAVLLAVLGRATTAAAVVGDLNEELVTAWQQVQRDPEAVSAALERYAERDNEAFYYSVRAQRFTTTLERAAHFIYLNRTSWNGLYRVNRQGEFNVPWGARAFSPPSPAALLDVARQTATTRVLHADFREILDLPVAGDFVYLDPPYLKISDTSKFNGYTQQRFRRDDLRDLVDQLDALTDRGVKWVLSNRDSDDVSELFSHYRIVKMTVRRSVAAQNKRHVEARYSPEVIVTNEVGE